ncbi:MAG TPA: DUF5808 domain-containing protein [Myxococcales bacterium]|nr:DUF5808 domain-containing protein [Myxococcales bacterium]
MKQAGPFAILGVAALWLHAHYDELPARIPVHWNAAGQANGFVMRTPAGAGSPLILGAVLCLVMVLVKRAMSGAEPSPLRDATLRVLLAVEYFIALLCCGVLAAMASNGRLLTPVLLGSFALVLALVIFAATSLRGLPQEPVRNPAAWRAGIFYYDPADPALFVPKRSGLGYTFNFGRPSAIILAIALIVLPIAIAVVTISAR